MSDWVRESQASSCGGDATLGALDLADWLDLDDVLPPVQPAPASSRVRRRQLRAADRGGDRRSGRRSARSRSGGTRVGVRVTQCAVVVALALGVGSFAFASQRSAHQNAIAESRFPVISAQVLGERLAAAVQAADAATQARTVRVEAEAASAADATSLASLNEAVGELRLLITSVQYSQPAITQLSPEVETSALVVGVDVEELESILNDSVITSPDSGTDTLAAGGDGATADPTATGDSTANAEATAPDGQGNVPAAGDTAITGDGAAIGDATDPAAAQILAASERVEVLTEQMRQATQDATEAAAAQAAADEEAIRQQEAAQAAAAAAAEIKAEQSASLEGYENGLIPSSALCGLSFTGGHLRCDAAQALDSLNDAYLAEFGTNMIVSDTYRSYAEQVACREHKGSLCAVPGTSNHGEGLAVDLGGKLASFNTTQHDWLLAHAEEYGWTLPSWARASGSKPEPWHWEYVG